MFVYNALANNSQEVYDNEKNYQVMKNIFNHTINFCMSTFVVLFFLSQVNLNKEPSLFAASNDISLNFVKFTKPATVKPVEVVKQQPPQQQKQTTVAKSVAKKKVIKKQKPKVVKNKVVEKVVVKKAEIKPQINLQPSVRKSYRPRYPKRAERMGQQGVVMMHAYVNSEGIPENFRVAQTSGFVLLDQAASNAIKKWRFDQQNQWVQIPFEFVIN